MTGSYAELELALHRSAAVGHEVELRFTNPSVDTEMAPVRGHAALDLEQLGGLQLQPEGYGRALSAAVFQEAVGQFYADFRQTTDDEVRRLLQAAWAELDDEGGADE